MQNFSFHNPTRILFGQGQLAELAREIPAGARVLITYGGGSVVKTGTLDEVKAALKDFTVFEFAGIEPNPTYETLMQAVEFARRERIDFLLAVGGGSVIDGTKFIAAAIPFAGDPWSILAEHAAVASAIPFGTVLTLPATGSEMNNFAVITRRASNDKLAFASPLVFPRFSVLDPTRTYTLPPRQVANGVVDAFVHVVEQYLTYPADAKVQDRFAEGLLLTLIEEGPKALRDAGKLRGARQPDVDRDAGAERSDRRRRAAGLGHAHARSRTHRAARTRPCANAGGRAAGDAAGAAHGKARQAVAVRRARMGLARGR